MLEGLQDQIPGFDSLQAKLQEWIGNPEVDLESIRSAIHEHILLAMDPTAAPVGEADDQMEADAFSTAHLAVDLLFDELPVDEANRDRIVEFLNWGNESYDGYRVLLTDFRRFLTPEEATEFLSRAKRIFAPDLVDEWK